MPFTTELILLIIFLFLSGFFSAAEVALVSISRLRLKHMLDKKTKGAETVQKLKKDPQRLLTTILIGNNLVNVAAASIATQVALSIFNNHAVAIATGVMTFLLLLFGEILPKTFAIRHNTKMALFFAPCIWYMSILILPVVRLFQHIITGFDLVFGGQKKATPAITEEELKSIVEFGKEEGAIKELERKMIHRIFDFDTKPISEVMTPKTDMETVSVKCTIKELLNLNKHVEFTRFPVWKRNKDNIVGILNLKDVFRHLKDGKLDMPLEKIMRKPLFVPESKKTDSLLRLFQKKKEHLAVVVDEHGAIAGLITIEDVLEEIVGEIVDETDRIDPHVVKIDGKSWRVKGKADLDEIKEKLSMAPKTDADTLNGFIQERTGQIPKEGTKVRYGKFLITVEKMDGHRVDTALIMKG